MPVTRWKPVCLGGVSPPGALTAPCVQDCTLRLWEYRRGLELHCCHLASLQEPAGPWSDKVTSFVSGCGGWRGALLVTWLVKRMFYIGNISLLCSCNPSSLGEITHFKF